MAKVCNLIMGANAGAFHLISTDEKTGIQALERKISRSSQTQRMEYEYIRHGTTCLLASLDVGEGKVVNHELKDSRKEDDFLHFIRQTVAQYDTQKPIIILADHLNTHMSASLVEWLAKEIGFEQDLGKKESRGILKSMQSRKEFLEDPSHRIRFVFTPKHCSWLNPVENWFSKLQRQVIQRGSFFSKEILCQKIENYIHYYNQYLYKTLNWKFKGFKEEDKFYQREMENNRIRT